jgi:hypothetical protein
MPVQRNDVLNGDYYDLNGVLVNIFGDPVRTDLDRPNDEMGKLAFGLLYNGAGEVHNINELLESGGGGGVAQSYVDTHDTMTLNAAKAYADTKARPLTKQEFWAAFSI